MCGLQKESHTFGRSEATFGNAFAGRGKVLQVQNLRQRVIIIFCKISEENRSCEIVDFQIFEFFRSDAP